MRDNIVVSMNNLLWDKASDNHYITQINPDKTTRDFVDYDSQLIAVAFGVTPMNKTQAVLKRVDSGSCTHARATYVSEKYYGPNDCNAGNTGDSAVTMGRIGWADGLARKRVGDVKTFNTLILEPLQNDLISKTWLYERYQCQAMPTHNPYYIEYPEVVAMLLREVRYGIDLGFSVVTVWPLGVDSFTYRIGNLYVDYSKSHVELQVTTAIPKGVIVYGLNADTKFSIVSENTQTHEKIPQTITTDSEGTLLFTTSLGPNWRITATSTSL